MKNCATCFHITHDQTDMMVCLHNRSMYVDGKDLIRAKLSLAQYHSTIWMREREDRCGKEGKLWRQAVPGIG